ncbi:MAG: type III-B CRISPR module-associated Cmr3 family protein [Comamonadaceae bacterium]|nr:type III-B CRISPR module-associated Cmr3 family protein [Comamonadaceae bacterium]
MTTATLICHFTPFDTWFFRESRPHGSVGSSELGSVFPPPVRTLAGALRTLIGDAWYSRHGGNWRSFQPGSPLANIIGYGDDLGPLRLGGPFITLDGQRLYPAPANLMCKQQGDATHYFLLALGEPVVCDLGRVHLPQFPRQVPGLDELAGSAPVQGGWLTQQGMQNVLNGQAPKAEDVKEASALFVSEPRLGIARDNRRKGVQEGLLYQTRHLRLRPGVGVELHLHGLADASLLPERTVIRLGGEGRQAALQVRQASGALLPFAPVHVQPAQTAVLYALTPLPCSAELPAGIPPQFKPATCAPANGSGPPAQVWEGALAGQRLRILSVANGRALREGGWDLASHRARPVHSLLAPGSALYVQGLDGQPLQASAFAQHADASGRGQFLLGALPGPQPQSL